MVSNGISSIEFIQRHVLPSHLYLVKLVDGLQLLHLSGGKFSPATWIGVKISVLHLLHLIYVFLEYLVLSINPKSLVIIDLIFSVCLTPDLSI